MRMPESEIQRVFRTLQKSTIQKVLKALILYINNFQKLLKNRKKKFFNKKIGRVIFFSQN